MTGLLSPVDVDQSCSGQGCCFSWGEGGVVVTVVDLFYFVFIRLYSLVMFKIKLISNIRER